MKLAVPLLILAVVVLVVLRVGYWCWGPHKRVPRYRVRYLRLRLRLRLYPGRGHATVFELWLRWSRFAAYRRSRRARMLLTWWQRALAGCCAWSIFIGRAHYRHGLRVPLEEHVLFVGPPRGGKTGVLASVIMRYPGPVLSSSTKADVFLLTSGLRAAVGPVHMFNPQGIGGIPSTFRWNPIAGCADPQVAIRRADAFSQAVSMGGVEDASFWTAKASDYLRAFFHAAALAGGDMRLVAGWVLTDNPGDAEQILAGHGAGEWAAQVAELRGAANKTIQTIRMTMSRSLAFLYDPQLAQAVLPAPGTGLDIPRFLARSGTLYMVAESRNDDASPVAALFACLANEVRFTAELTGSTMPGGRLDPPLLMALDEIVQTCPVPLPSWLSDAGGKGIQILVVTHGTGQLKSRWQDNGAQVILDTCGTQVWLPGITDTDTLDKASKLCGQAGLYEHTRPRGLSGRRDRYPGDERLSRVDVMSPDMIRQLPEGRALVIRGSLAPVVVKLPRAWKTRQYRRARRRGLAVAALTPAPALGLSGPGSSTPPGPDTVGSRVPDPAAPSPDRAPGAPELPAARRAHSHLQLLPGGAGLDDEKTDEAPAGHYPWSPQ
jgi:type IV secretion system protein VirD4